MKLPSAPADPAVPSRRATRLGRWATTLVFVGAGMVYLSLALKRLWILIAGEILCLLAAAVILWMDRTALLDWFDSRPACPGCGEKIPPVNGRCPSCNYLYPF